ncbi:MAG TPA: hypothetical protein VL966_09715 [Alphaproteobacteria bacterium]|jgi:hypothetical protein|nr:hypothetical protein [Alphaproteobacteria bacterium]
MTTIDATELHDFESALKRRGIPEADFALKEQEQPIRGEALQPILGTVTVTYMKTGIALTYQTGHRSSWPAEFERDLDAGRFEK